MESLIDKFGSARILVVGDLMLDRYFKGVARRISPEAPVPVVEVDKVYSFPGGAANVACNIASMGGKCYISGAVGNDDNGNELIEELKDKGINTEYVVQQGITTTKLRVVAHNQQIVRADFEKKEPKNIYLFPEPGQVNAVIISDYAKGVVTSELCSIVTRKYLGVPILVDPKPKNMSLYKAGLYKLNRSEAQEIAGVDCSSIEGLMRAGEKMVETYAADIIITASEDGAYIFDTKGKTHHVPSEARDIGDVTGAGDCFIATLALAMASGGGLEKAVLLANKAAGIKCGKFGTATVSADELRSALKESEQ